MREGEEGVLSLASRSRMSSDGERRSVVERRVERQPGCIVAANEPESSDSVKGYLQCWLAEEQRLGKRWWVGTLCARGGGVVVEGSCERLVKCLCREDLTLACLLISLVPCSVVCSVWLCCNTV
jgi:hypothetical protein